MMVPACLMGPFYAHLKHVTDYLVSNGVEEQAAGLYTGRAYLGMAQDAARHCDRVGYFQELVEEQTPGGINAMSIDNCVNVGVFEGYTQAYDGVLERLEGRGDGKRGEKKE